MNTANTISALNKINAANTISTLNISIKEVYTALYIVKKFNFSIHYNNHCYADFVNGNPQEDIYEGHNMGIEL